MTDVCNWAIKIQDPALEQLKNREIEVGSAALLSASAEILRLESALELQQEEQYRPRIQEALLGLREASDHYTRVLGIVECAEVRPEYRDWLQRVRYDRLHLALVEGGELMDEAPIWASVIAPLEEAGDAARGFREAFLTRLDGLVAHLESMALDAECGAGGRRPSLVPEAFWRLQTLMGEVLQAGQAIAIINALDLEDPRYT